ncbi:sensor histidine kinase [Arundinibacter roseus]|uniref:histidine kinase n=1 Tax=Arundinibacter roseus TaxID=2070510 RepID=A0A4R4JRZ1_9BACT|nr:ATP-binding protein [Arundinibacter roseus]TDB57357.1 GHKL domain-containing protein [Arundinibacter roseus]
MELVYFLIILFSTQYLRDTLHTKTEDPETDKRLNFLRIAAIVYFCISMVTSFDDQTGGMWLWHVLIVAFFWYLNHDEKFKSGKSYFQSFYAPIVIAIFLDVVSVALPTFYSKYDSYLDSFSSIAFIWVIAIWYQNRKQQKQLAAERLQRLEEEKQNQLIAAQKAELELVVGERTREILQQKEELETTLQHLQATQVQLIQSEKMASLGELTAGIAHEIQNPLNFVNNFAEVNTELIEELKEEQEKESPDLELIEEILTDLADNMQKMVYHGKRADSIVKGMLLHSRSGSGEKQLVDINALADEYMRLAYHGLRAKDKSFNAALEKNFQTDPLMGQVMPQDFGRVLLNIFNNAFYAVMERKREEGENFQPTVWLSTSQEENFLLIKIRDNGTGIPDAVKEKIFQPFFTTKPTGQGTGLGLSLSYDIIHKGHNGTLTVTSEKNSFTEFCVQIPLIN